MSFNGNWYRTRNNTKPWVKRKPRTLHWGYPWVAFNGQATIECETWREAMDFALSQGVYGW